MEEWSLWDFSWRFRCVSVRIGTYQTFSDNIDHWVTFYGQKISPGVFQTYISIIKGDNQKDNRHLNFHIPSEDICEIETSCRNGFVNVISICITSRFYEQIQAKFNLNLRHHLDCNDETPRKIILLPEYMPEEKMSILTRFYGITKVKGTVEDKLWNKFKSDWIRIQCPICDTYLFNGTKFLCHLADGKHFLQKIKISMNIPKKFNANNGEKCSYCSYVAKNPRDLVKHYGCEHELSLKFLNEREGKMNTFDASILKTYQRYDIPKGNSNHMICPIPSCKAMFYHKYLLMDHLRFCHFHEKICQTIDEIGESPYKCPLCDEKFENGVDDLYSGKDKFHKHYALKHKQIEKWLEEMGIYNLKSNKFLRGDLVWYITKTTSDEFNIEFTEGVKDEELVNTIIDGKLEEIDLYIVIDQDNPEDYYTSNCVPFGTSFGESSSRYVKNAFLHGFEKYQTIGEIEAKFEKHLKKEAFENLLIKFNEAKGMNFKNLEMEEKVKYLTDVKKIDVNETNSSSGSSSSSASTSQQARKFKKKSGQKNS